MEPETHTCLSSVWVLFEISAKSVIGTRTTLQTAKAQWAMALDFKAKEGLWEIQKITAVVAVFDPNLEIHLACDAPSYGIGAVLSRKIPDGSERPVGFVSCTLTDAKKKYSQIEKEGLACVHGVTRFYSYLFGHHFKLQTDHKTLLTLFNESKAVSPNVVMWSVYTSRTTGCNCLWLCFLHHTVPPTLQIGKGVLQRHHVLLLSSGGTDHTLCSHPDPSSNNDLLRTS